jgi:hypothetical protein
MLGDFLQTRLVTLDWIDTIVRRLVTDDDHLSLPTSNTTKILEGTRALEHIL